MRVSRTPKSPTGGWMAEQQHHKPQGRILGIDFGRKYLGIATSDELGLLARGLQTLVRKNLRQDVAELARLCRELGVTKIVIGNPIQLDGSPSELSHEVERFARRLREHTGLEVELWDERFTTEQATRILEATRGPGEGHKWRKHKLTLDCLAAELLLQSYLDAKRLKENQGECTGDT